MIRVERYSSENKTAWNQFNKNSKAPLFMFDRGYMDYHSDRFYDHSLMLYRDDKLIALLPANEKDGALISHGGLTYGALIVDSEIKQHTVIDCFFCIKDYMYANNLRTFVYKPVPHIFHELPCEEDLYALFLIGAQLKSVSVSTVIDLHSPLKMPKGRKAQISRAVREGVKVKCLEDKKSFDCFFEIENAVLESRHNTHAVHTSDELFLLKERFPDNIHLYCSEYNNEIIAGVVMYEYNQVIHTQYMGANDIARQIGALDLIVKTLIEKYGTYKHWLDFGISTENEGRLLNEGLIAQKESFGGRSNIYQSWILELG